MKRKLTLSVEEELVEYGKQYAAQQHKSLSQVVEEALREIREAGQPTFSQRWRGKFAKRNRPGDPRMEYLEKRYR